MSFGSPPMGVVAPASEMQVKKTKLSSEGNSQLDAIGTASQNVIERKIIRTVTLTVEVKHVDEAFESTKEMAEGLGGFISNSLSYEDNTGQTAMNVTIRIPAEKINETVSKIKGLGRVNREAMSGDDITEQYVDVEARLSNARKLEAKLLTLLDTKTNRLKDLVEVEKELASVRENIESYEGRKRVWDNELNYSTITVSFVEPRGFGLGIFSPLSGLFQRSLQALTSSIAWLIVIVSAALPWLIVLFFLTWGALRLLKVWVRHKRELKQRKTEKNT